MTGWLGGVQEISKHHDSVKYILAQMEKLFKPDWAIGLEVKNVWNNQSLQSSL